MPKVSEQYKEEKRALVLQSAMSCFAQKGYAATSIDDIVKTAKMSKGAIYNYFKSKEEIFLTILDARMSDMENALDEMFAGVTTATEKVSRLIRNYIRLPNAPEARMWVLIQLEFELYVTRHQELRFIPEKSEAFLQEIYGRIIREGIESGEFHPDLNHKAATHLFWMIRDGIAVHMSLMFREGLPYEPFLEGAESMLLSFLKNNK